VTSKKLAPGDGGGDYRFYHRAGYQNRTMDRDGDRKTTVEVTYRFEPPKTAQPALPEDYGELEQADEILVGVVQNSGPREAE
jgi:hypothetical protein